VTLREPCLILFAVAALAACGDDVQDDPDGGMVTCTTPAAERYLPLAVGASWTYDTSDMGAPPQSKVTTIEAFEDIGDRKTGIIGFRQRTEKLAGYSLSWHSDDCTAINRHREQSFDTAGTLATDQFYVPAKLRVDETAAHLTLGATWTTAYTEVEVDAVTGTHTVSKDETWTVEAVDETVTVPAGTFTALKLRKVTSGDADKVYWFAKGIGKVKEEGEQVESLTAYTQP
jgi:hypothetical protein